MYKWLVRVIVFVSLLCMATYIRFVKNIPVGVNEKEVTEYQFVDQVAITSKLVLSSRYEAIINVLSGCSIRNIKLPYSVEDWEFWVILHDDWMWEWDTPYLTYVNNSTVTWTRLTIHCEPSETIYKNSWSVSIHNSFEYLENEFSTDLQNWRRQVRENSGPSWYAENDGLYRLYFIYVGNRYFVIQAYIGKLHADEYLDKVVWWKLDNISQQDVWDSVRTIAESVVFNN